MGVVYSAMRVTAPISAIELRTGAVSTTSYFHHAAYA